MKLFVIFVKNFQYTKMLFSRPKYIQKIKPYINKHIIKVLVGERRVGKTYLLRLLMDEIKTVNPRANIIYIDKEAPEFAQITTGKQLFDYVENKASKDTANYVFIDEIQEIKDFEIGLKYMFSKEYDIYITGSNARLMSSDLATYLSGRYVEFRIFPLSYTEFLAFHQLPDNDQSLQKYIKFGGFPFLVNLPLEDEVVYNYLKSVYNTIILKDVVSRFKVKEVDFLERLILFLAQNEGSLISIKRITQFLKSQQINMSMNTVSNYIKYLTDAFFIEKVRRFDIKGKRIFEINEKYYFSDLGLKHSLIKYNPALINQALENLVFNKLKQDGFQVFVGKLDNNEIDFIATRGDLTVYLQVIYLLREEQTIQREFSNLLKIKDNYPKYVISADPLASGSYLGIQHLYIRDFLTRQQW